MKSPRERLVLIADSKCAKFFHTKNFKMKGEIHLSTIDDFDIHHKIQEKHTGGVHKAGTQDHSFDPGYDVKELTRKDFTKKVIKTVLDEYHIHKFEELVIVAGPKILGDIRAYMPKELQKLDIKEIHKDITHFSRPEVEKYLMEVC